MIRPLILSAALALSLTPANATGVDQLAQSVARDLPHYGFDVDVATLSPHQLASLNLIMHGGFSAGETITRIKSELGGRHSLRSLLFGNN